MLKRLGLVVAGALLFANAAQAAVASCSSGSPTVMSSGGTQLFGNSFTAAQSFSDCYAFTLPTPKNGNAVGGTLTIDPLSRLDITISSIGLTGGSVAGTILDTMPGVFAFNGLLSGTYHLLVSGVVSRGRGFDDILPLPVGYVGSLTFNEIVTPAVPEPSTWAMMLLGFGGLGYLAWRRRPAARRPAA